MVGSGCLARVVVGLHAKVARGYQPCSLMVSLQECKLAMVWDLQRLLQVNGRQDVVTA